MFETYTKLLREYVQFKSISTDLSFKGDILKQVEWLTYVLKEYGFKVEILKGDMCNPIVLASYDAKQNETVLIYGHYDVQPAEKSDGWVDEPFDMSVRNGRIYARGVVDNKGQNLIHIVTVGELIKTGVLKYNVKFMIEGNEETANPDIPKIVEKNKKKLSADHIIISDGEIVGTTPTIEAALRGGFNMKVTLTTGKSNLHSGLYGGAIPNAGNELSKILASLFDQNNKVTVPGFYIGVPTISASLKKQNRNIQTDNEVLKVAGVKALLPEKGLDFFSQTGLRPTLQVTGIKTGYIGEGYANIVPASAEARINVRVVGKQKPALIYKKIKNYIESQTPTYASMKIEHTEFNDPVSIDVNASKVREVRALLKQSYGREPLIRYVGGSIPIVSDFKKLLGKEALLVSLGNDDCNMHGINENFRVDLIKKGLAFSRAFFEK